MLEVGQNESNPAEISEVDFSLSKLLHKFLICVRSFQFIGKAGLARKILQQGLILPFKVFPFFVREDACLDRYILEVHMHGRGVASKNKQGQDQPYPRKNYPRLLADASN